MVMLCCRHGSLFAFVSHAPKEERKAVEQFELAPLTAHRATHAELLDSQTNATLARARFQLWLCCVDTAVTRAGGKGGRSKFCLSDGLKLVYLTAMTTTYVLYTIATCSMIWLAPVNSLERLGVISVNITTTSQVKITREL